jgi:hypothetical protein
MLRRAPGLESRHTEEPGEDMAIHLTNKNLLLALIRL